ncbi:hypothetical protein TL16_g00933 [Triparma laevis f. inornata]|uniref:JmjC domain-containing protein n=1 Tax=Triparma laevis f. inornata TaxID=1714386 RepID=A0A9W6ZIC4_9STRA|nr:hypothetical protein TL16_g00933 [Triparma laevis f. inornata]
MYLFERGFTDYGLGNDYVPHLSSSMPWFVKNCTKKISNKIHRPDLFHFLGDMRPDFRWLISGPTRSGSAFHIDPNATNAWNLPIRGRKLWIFYPPGVCPPGVRVLGGGRRLLCLFNEGGPDAPLECRVDVGECLFVPHGWWHCVINVEEEGGGLNDNVSLALTQNYVSSSNLSDVLRFLEVNKNQISGCRDRGKSAVDPETFGEVFKEKLKKVMEEEEFNEVIERSKRWECGAWENEKVSVMEIAKKGEWGEKEGEEGGGDGGFSFGFGL